jgi:hypothetical protein
MKPRDYFPLGKAHGGAFCNREVETNWLLNNVLACKHSLLIAPRRFGKSSLADKVIEASKLPITCLNFNTCADERDIEALIRQGVSQLIGRALGPVDKVIHSIKNYVSHLTPKISFGAELAHLELTTNQHSSATSNVEEALSLMEKLLVDKKRKAVMLFDEFQVVGAIAKGSGVEAAIRNVAQDTKNLSIIFSGSSRHLLQSMFEDEGRPLYKLCRKLHLKRIDKVHYQKQLNQAAQMAWGQDLSETVFEHIMLLSERHPHYVNYLCDMIWAECTTLPSISDVDSAWLMVIDEEQSDANAEISSLSMGQKKIMKFVANYSGENIMSVGTTKEVGMALSSIASALTGLMEKDMIEKHEDGYKIINPIVHYLLKESVSLS